MILLLYKCYQTLQLFSKPCKWLNKEELELELELEEWEEWEDLEDKEDKCQIFKDY